MIPLKDDVPSERIPFITLGLIGLNVLVFLYQASIGMGGDPRAAEAVAFEFGATPCRITGACPVPGDFPSPVATIFTSMFLHGGLLHVGGNMLYLWIFGNVEDTLGHGRYLTPICLRACRPRAPKWPCIPVHLSR
jgi:membrane associated rhomboid family serine protease